MDHQASGAFFSPNARSDKIATRVNVLFVLPCRFRQQESIYFTGETASPKCIHEFFGARLRERRVRTSQMNQKRAKQ